MNIHHLIPWDEDNISKAFLTDCLSRLKKKPKTKNKPRYLTELLKGNSFMDETVLLYQIIPSTSPQLVHDQPQAAPKPRVPIRKRHFLMPSAWLSAQLLYLGQASSKGP